MRYVDEILCIVYYVKNVLEYHVWFCPYSSENMPVPIKTGYCNNWELI